MHALDELIEIGQTKMPTLQPGSTGRQNQLRRSSSRGRKRRWRLRAPFCTKVSTTCGESLKSGSPHTRKRLPMNRVACLNAAETGASVTRTVNTLGGGSALFTRSSLQRHMRDAEAITHHFTVAPFVWEDAGRIFFGRAPLAPIF